MSYPATLDPACTTVYCDVDGTIVSKSNQPSTQVIDMVQQFVGAGFRLTLATGRNWRAVQRLQTLLPINAPMVLCNGAHIYCAKTNFSYFTCLTHESSQILLRELLKVENAVVYADTTNLQTFVSSPDALTDDYARREKLSLTVFTEAEEVAEQDFIKVGVKLLDASRESIDAVHNALQRVQQRIPGELQSCLSSSDYIEVMKAGVSKWSGIQISQKIMGRDDTIVAIGDHCNDIEMLSNSHISVAMGNAVDAVKECAQFCTTSVEDDGVVKFLQSIRRQQRVVNL